MALVMTVTYMPAAAFAEPIPEQNAAQTDTQTEAAETSDTGSGTEEKSGSEDEPAVSDAEKAAVDETEAFAREATIDDVIISVEAEPGVFPADASL